MDFFTLQLTKPRVYIIMLNLFIFWVPDVFLFQFNFLFYFQTGKIIPFVELTVAHASVLTILAITFERYYAICEPLRAGYVCTKARAFMICIITWFVAAFCTR